MKINGLIIQRQSQSLYQGVDGDNWYLNYCSHKELDAFFKCNVERAWSDNSYVDACNDLDFIKKYSFISASMNIKFKILACVTERPFPQMVLEERVKFLGYDYAYSGGSYYSAVLNDVVSKRIPQFLGISLNKYGLFDTYEEINAFVYNRKFLENSNGLQSEYMEEGDFIIYKLYEVFLREETTNFRN